MLQGSHDEVLYVRLLHPEHFERLNHPQCLDGRNRRKRITVVFVHSSIVSLRGEVILNDLVQVHRLMFCM